jgi:S1-C subfamily serine protease
VFLAASISYFSPPVWAQEPVIEDAGTSTAIDTIFRGSSVPQTVEELRAMEKRQTEMVSKVTPCTVGLQIGQAQGSGVIVTGDGYVLTAAHVAQRPDLNVQVILHDGRVVRGKTLGLDRSSDAGLIKIESAAEDGGEWPHLEMGSSADLAQGQWCLVTGHPGGYEAGRPPVVRLGRLLAVNEDLLITDCPLVGGDSGGPLLDMAGEVVGIHSRIGGAITANMHVPIDIYQENWDRMVAGEMWGDVPHGAPYIGVRGEPDVQEAKIAYVQPGEPADRAGLRAGDVVTKFGDTDISTFA